MLRATQRENQRKAEAKKKKKKKENQRKAELEQEKLRIDEKLQLDKVNLKWFLSRNWCKPSRGEVRFRNEAKRGRNQEKRQKSCNWQVSTRSRRVKGTKSFYRIKENQHKVTKDRTLKIWRSNYQMARILGHIWSCYTWQSVVTSNRKVQLLESTDRKWSLKVDCRTWTDQCKLWGCHQSFEGKVW